MWTNSFRPRFYVIGLPGAFEKGIDGDNLDE